MTIRNANNKNLEQFAEADALAKLFVAQEFADTESAEVDAIESGRRQRFRLMALLLIPAAIALLLLPVLAVLGSR